MGIFNIRAALLKIWQNGAGIAEVQIDSLEGVGDRYIGADADGKIKAMPTPSGGSVTAKAVCDALGYRPSANPIPMDDDINTDFVILANCAVVNDGVYSFGNPINWLLLNRGSGHGSMFFLSIDTVTNAPRMNLNYPRVRTVMGGDCNLDDTAASLNLFMGASTTFTEMIIFVGAPVLINTTLVPNGSGGWSNANSNMNTFVTASAFGAPDGLSETGLNFSNIPLPDYWKTTITYQGLKNWIVNRRYAATGSYNAVFKFKDASTGADITADPDTDDYVTVSGLGITNQQVRLDYWDGSNEGVANTSFAILVYAKFEVWMFATSISGTENLIRYQLNYPGATNYKIYRDTDPAFGSQVLIHTGTEGVYNDTGLTANTQYYYKYVAVVGSDVDVTTWPQKTRA